MEYGSCCDVLSLISASIQLSTAKRRNWLFCCWINEIYFLTIHSDIPLFIETTLAGKLESNPAFIIDKSH